MQQTRRAKKRKRSQKKTEKENLGFAEGLMRMNFKGAFESLRLSRLRAQSLIKILPETIYYLPDCRNECPEDECLCHDPYFSAIDWLKNYIFSVYPDLSDVNAGLIETGFYSQRPLTKKDAIYLGEVIKIAEDFADDRTSRKALDWASNIIHKNYAIFELTSCGVEFES